MHPADPESLCKAQNNSVPSTVQKTISGAIIVSRDEFNNKRRELSSKKRNAAYKKNLASRKRKMPITEHENDKKCKRMLIMNKKQLPDDTLTNNAELNISFKNLSVTTQMGNHSTKIKPKTSAAALQFSHSTQWGPKHRLDGQQLFELMMKTEIKGARVNFDYKACLKDIGLILTEFQNRHGNYAYHTVLRRILKEECLKIPKKQIQITLKQYQLFVYKVTAKVIPKALFGCNKNLKILRNALKEYFLSPYRTQLDLKKSILRLDISQILWLQQIKNKEIQWVVLAKLTKWLFENFFAKLFKTVFCEQKSLYSNKRIMIIADMWNNIQRDYIVRQVNEGRVVKLTKDAKTPEDECKMAVIPSTKMTLHPKLQGVRPIYRLRRTELQNDELNKLRILLQQLYRRKYGSTNNKELHSTWLLYANANEENISRKVNVVTCDVADAFGSIIQKKLFDIVSSMIDEVPYETLTLQSYEVLLPKSKNGKLTTLSKRWFSCWPETFNAPSFSFITISEKSVGTVVEKKKVKADLAASVFNQIFVYRRQEYVLKKGIIQGSTLSSILSDIYYQEMMIQEFGIFMQSGTILRYVDDYMYITKNEDLAKSFLKAIKEFVPEYNCRFNKTKIKTNVESRACNKYEWVNYLGYELNGETMEVRPKYEKHEFQYVQCIQRVARKNSLPLLKTLFKNITCLKLNHFVLDPKINSPNRLCESARLAANLLARRCAICIKTIFDDPSKHRDGILKTIQNVVARVTAIFRQYLTATDRAKRRTFRRNIKIAIWQSFFRVFTRYLELRIPFCQYMKIMIQNQTVF